MRSIEAVRFALTAGLIVHTLQGDERQQPTETFPEEKERMAMLSPTFPRSEDIFTRTFQLHHPLSHNMLQKEQELLYRPLVIVYADGLGGGGPKGRPFYEAVQKNDLRVPWITVTPDRPGDPDPLDWKKKTFAVLQTAVAENNDVLAVGYSAGSVLWGAMLNDLLDPTSSFYNLEIASHIKGITLYAAPDVTSTKSAQRPKLKNFPSYQKFFGISDEGIGRINEMFGNSMTIIVGAYDTELNAEGKALAIKLGASVREVDANHGMNSLETSRRDPTRDPELVASSVFEKMVINHRIAQDLKLFSTK